MHSSHEECFLCRRAHPGKYEYYRDYNQLEEHFSIKHYPCMHRVCRERKFVVFSTETDLKKHTAKEHGDMLSKAEKKQALQVPVNFTYSSSNGGGGGGVSSSSLAAGMAGITIGGGPPSVPSRYGRRGGSGNSSSSGRGDVRIIDEQQQQQQQQQQAFLLSAAATQRGQGDVDLDPSDFPAGGLTSSSSSMIGGGGGGRWAAATGGGNGGGLRPEEFPSLPGSSKSAKKRANMKKKSLAESLRGATGGGGVRVVSTAGSSGNSFPPLKPSSSSNSGDGHTDIPGYNNSSGTGHQQKQQHQMTRAPSSQEIAGPSISLSSTASVSQGLRQANMALIQQIKSKLNASEFQQFRDVSSSWLKGSVSSKEYHSVITTLGLVEVVPDLAATCPDAEKRGELLGVHKVAFIKTTNKNNNNNNNNGSSYTSDNTSGWVPPEVAAERAERYSSWTCSLCTLVNGPRGRVCEACGTPAPQPGDESNHWRREKNEGEGGGGGGGGVMAPTPAASVGEAFPSLPMASLTSSSSSSGITFTTAAANGKGKGKQKLSYGEFVSQTKVHPQNVWRNPNLKGKWSKTGALAQEERALKDAWGKK